MNREQLDEIRTRAEGLEGGAWYVGARECVDDIDLYRLPVLVEDSAEADAEDVRVAAVDYRTFGYQYPHGDAQQLAEFIARARTDVGALLDEIDRRDRESDRLWAMVGRVHAVASAAARGGVTLDPAEVIRALEAAAGATTAEGSAEGGTSKDSSKSSCPSCAPLGGCDGPGGGEQP